ncbi:MAG: pyridoxal-phosphate dependent enzyme, partial [Gemmatimonadetes bacterium]|nr:pyridoxal-phosphate dependent enzyme [Gemmatimonadota bacterium]
PLFFNATAPPDIYTSLIGGTVTWVKAHFLILRALRESGGGAVAVTDRAMAEWVEAMGAATGIFGAPEGGATAAAVPRLLEMGLIRESDEVVLFNTGSGLKYVGMEPVD